MVRLIAEDDDTNQDHLSTPTNIIITICLCSGQPLVKLIAEDEDKNQGHKFRIMADSSGLFSTDGESLMASETLDYERDPARQFVITVQVTDDGTPPMTVSVTGTVVAVFTSFL